MKTYEETLAVVLKRRDDYEHERNERRAMTKKIAVPAVCCLAVAAAAFGVKAALPKKTVPIAESAVQKDRGTEDPASVTAPAAQPDVPSGEAVVSGESGPSGSAAAASTSPAPASATVPSAAPTTAAASAPSTAERPELAPETPADPGAKTPSGTGPASATASSPETATVNVPARVTVPASAIAPDRRAVTATVTAPATVPSGEPASSAASSVTSSSAHEDTSSTAAPPPDRTAVSSAARPDGGNYGGESGGMDVRIPALPANREIVEVGEQISDEEAAAYFAQNLGSLASSLSASGVEADSLRVSTKGYSHVCYSGVEGERLEARLNFRDYLVYNGEKLVSIVTLYKEDGKLYSTPAFGAPWFDAYDAFLRDRRGQALVYVYAGFAEIILTPDGQICSPLGGGTDASRYFEGVDDPYSLFFHPAAMYIP